MFRTCSVLRHSKLNDHAKTQRKVRKKGFPVFFVTSINELGIKVSIVLCQSDVKPIR